MGSKSRDAEGLVYRDAAGLRHVIPAGYVFLQKVRTLPIREGAYTGSRWTAVFVRAGHHLTVPVEALTPHARTHLGLAHG